VGVNGVGKTTLLKVIGLQENKFSGSYLFNGNDVRTMKKKDINTIRKNEISYIFSDYRMIEELSVYDNLVLVCQLLELNVNINEILSKVSLYKKKNELIKNLSDGEIQRVAIARCLLKNPSIILADEPTSNLDYVNKNTILKLLKSLDIAIIFVTHDISIINSNDNVINMVRRNDEDSTNSYKAP